jgi:uncharacterized peroxidase-related enzyme
LGDDFLARTLVKDHRKAILSQQDHAMLDYAVKLTIKPIEVEESDVVYLKEMGFDDTGVLDICQVTAYFNYVNRLADGLGVELESDWEGDLTVTEEEFKTWAIEKDSLKDPL